MASPRVRIAIKRIRDARTKRPGDGQARGRKLVTQSESQTEPFCSEPVSVIGLLQTKQRYKKQAQIAWVSPLLRLY